MAALKTSAKTFGLLFVCLVVCLSTGPQFIPWAVKCLHPGRSCYGLRRYLESNNYCFLVPVKNDLEKRIAVRARNCHSARLQKVSCVRKPSEHCTGTHTCCIAPWLHNVFHSVRSRFSLALQEVFKDLPLSGPNSLNPWTAITQYI